MLDVINSLYYLDFLYSVIFGGFLVNSDLLPSQHFRNLSDSTNFVNSADKLKVFEKFIDKKQIFSVVMRNIKIKRSIFMIV